LDERTRSQHQLLLSWLALHVVVTGAHGVGQTASQDNSHDLQTQHPHQQKQVVTVISQKGRIAAVHGRFNRIRQVAPVRISI